MTEVHIVYTGVISFFLGKDKGKISTLWVLAPNGDHAAHRHQMWLGCRQDQVHTADGLTLLAKAHIPSRTSKAEAVTKYAVAYGIRGPMKVKGITTSQLKVSPADLKQKLVPLSRLACGPSDKPAKEMKLMAKHLYQTYKRDSSFRTAIRSGTVEATYVDPDEKWWFSNNPDMIFTLAEEICHSFEVDDTVILDFGDGRLKLKDDEERIVIKIGNTLEMDLLYPRSKPSDVDFHVRLFDKLAASSAEHLPYLIGECNGAKSGHPGTFCGDDHNHDWADPIQNKGCRLVGGANCPPGWWDEAG